MITFFKNQFSWKNTIYVLGLPRSGKSTIFNLIASCADVQGVDEPFELQVIAQKGGEYETSSPHFAALNDAYLVMMENYFSELILGRRYNFRNIDKSCILNIKSQSEVNASLSRRGRTDVLSYARNTNATFVVAYNNVENALEFITQGAPSPKIIYVSRNIDDVATAIAEKKWLSDEQLSGQTNLGSSFRTVVQSGSKLLYVPYQIPESLHSVFVESNSIRRAEIYCRCQADSFHTALSKSNVKCLWIEFEDFLRDPNKVLTEIFRFADIKSGSLTSKLLSTLK